MAKQKWAPGNKGNTSSGGEHFATRTRANDFVRIMRHLPDPDPVLKKMGKGITALQELLSDSHLESVWGVRSAAVSGAEWFIAPAENGGDREQEAADAFAAELKDMDIPRIIEEMMDAVAFGFSPLEILWAAKNGRWGIEDIVGKPPQWFEFNQKNELLFKTGALNTEELPPGRFLLVQHRSSYANPYGVKVFSKCFWPVTFKKNGFRWWTVFVEKYGGAFTYGKYAANFSEQHKAELLSALERLITDAVAIIPEGSEINITSAAEKSGSTSVHERYIQMANAEISKAVLGETLTTEIGERGSYAAAQTHNQVRKDIATADRRRISAAFNRLASLYTFYNFGENVGTPQFEFVKDEDLQTERAARDVQVYKAGGRPTKEYFMRQYGFLEDEINVKESGGALAGFSMGGAFPQFENSFCGCKNAKKKLSIFEKIASLFASREQRALRKDDRLMERFGQTMLKAGQQELDKTVGNFLDALGQVQDYDEAEKALISVYGKLPHQNTASLINEIRYASSQIGAGSVQRGARRYG